MKILLSGQPRIGKTTIINEVTNKWRDQGLKVKGIICREVMGENGFRLGFILENMDGEQRLFAHKTDVQSDIEVPSRDGHPYYVDIQALNEFSVPEIKSGIGDKNVLLIIDEIGKMESYSPEFLQVCEDALKSDSNILGIITANREPWTDRFTSIQDVKIIDVNLENRESLPAELIQQFLPQENQETTTEIHHKL